MAVDSNGHQLADGNKVTKAGHEYTVSVINGDEITYTNDKNKEFNCASKLVTLVPANPAVPATPPTQVTNATRDQLDPRNPQA